MKNSVTATTGIKAYALVTQQAAGAIGLPDFFAGAIRHVEHSDDFGDTVCYVYDLAPIYARWRASRRIVRCYQTSRWRSNRWKSTCRCRRPSPGLTSPMSTRRFAGSRGSTA